MILYGFTCHRFPSGSGVSFGATYHKLGKAMQGHRLCLAAREVLLLSARKQPIELTAFGLVMNVICHGQQRG